MHLLDTWMHQINTHDVDAICKLYNAQGILHPTLSARLLTTPEGIRGYFAQFLSLKNLKGNLIGDAEICHSGTDQELLLAAGFYSFQYEEKGDLTSLMARFTFAWNSEGTILHHHSSATPQP